MSFTWTDIHAIAAELAAEYPDVDPMSLRFTHLREMIESLEDFDPDPGQTVNEAILEAIQSAWMDEARP